MVGVNERCHVCERWPGDITVNMADTDGGTLVEVCDECVGQIREASEQFDTDECVFCRSTEQPSRSRGLVFEDGSGAHVCDSCRRQFLQYGNTVSFDHIIEQDHEAKTPVNEVYVNLEARQVVVEECVACAETHRHGAMDEQIARGGRSHRVAHCRTNQSGYYLQLADDADPPERWFSALGVDVDEGGGGPA